MRIDFDDDELQKLYEDPRHHSPRLGRDVVKAFRKKLGFVLAADSELDLRNYKALHFEKLAGARAGQHSIRLNDQWRLILRLERDAHGKVIIVVEIVDYH